MLAKKANRTAENLATCGKSKIPRMFAHYLLTEGTGEAQIRPSVGDLCSILSVRIEAVPFRDISAQNFRSPEHRLSANCLAQAPRTQTRRVLPFANYRTSVRGSFRVKKWKFHDVQYSSAYRVILSISRIVRCAGAS